jgi:hypothetical protein
LDNCPFTAVRAASHIYSEKNKLILGPFLTSDMQQMGARREGKLSPLLKEKCTQFIGRFGEARDQERITVRFSNE